MSGVAEPDYIDAPFSYLKDFTLTANQTATGLAIALDDDAPFYFRGFCSTQTDVRWKIRWQDANSRFCQNAAVFSSNLQGLGPMPEVQNPEVPYPAGGQIKFDAIDTSGSSNVIQVTFKGVKRIPKMMAQGCGVTR